MFKPVTRTAHPAQGPAAGFAETQFLHGAEDDDYSGFAPTQLFDQDDTSPAAGATGELARQASSASTISEPVPSADGADEPSMPASWVTSQWVAAQEAKAHDAAHQARAVIAAQRRAEQLAPGSEAAAETAVPRTGFGRLRAAFEKLLPGEFRSLLSLFIGVTATMAVISAVLPIIDRR